MSAAPSTPATGPTAARSDYTVIGLIGLAHGSSHFFHMLLPPLFPVFIRDFGLNYSQLGLLVTLFFTVSGVGQAVAGFVVDRVGARPVLFAALLCFTAAALLAAAAQGYGGLMGAAALAGLGNAPFHPADFTILNKRVSPARLGHAFAVHGVSGNLGWALAPAFLIGIGQVSGNWRVACLSAALLPLAVLALFLVHRQALDDRRGAWVHERAGTVVATHALAFMKLPAVWLCFSFFFWSTAALAAVQGFAGPALARMYGLPLATTAAVVTGFLVCAAAGMVLGGFVVARVQHLERTIALALATAAGLLLLVASGVLPPLLAGAAVALAGAGTGLAGPSRDMLIRRAAPPAATGRVYGTVYSGLDAGFALAAPAFGSLLDRDLPNAVFVGAAAVLLMGVASAALVGWRVRLTARALAAST